MMALPKQHFNIVALETFFTPLPPLKLPEPHTFSVTEYSRTTIAEIPSRIRDAHILITTTIALSANSLSPEVSPNLRLIAVLASGTDSIDLDACRSRGIRVLNSPGCNVDAVAEHAVALYFAARRSVVPGLTGLRAGDWARKGSIMNTAFAGGQSPPSCRHETAVIIGHGAIGQKIQTLLSALGLKVVIASRKNSAAPVPPGRVAFKEAVQMATVLILCCPRTPDTINMIAAPEFAMMRADAVVVNVARGGIVSEADLLEALKGGKIAGAAADVFLKEPASQETCVLLGPDAEGLNLVLTPHTAWVGMDTTANYRRVLQENIDGFFLDELQADRIKA